MGQVELTEWEQRAAISVFAKSHTQNLFAGGKESTENLVFLTDLLSAGVLKYIFDITQIIPYNIYQEPNNI